MNNIIRLMVMPCKPELHRKWAGVFEAKLGETIICRSRQPFVDGEPCWRWAMTRKWCSSCGTRLPARTHSRRSSGSQQN
jgi:hypothetical protein